MPVSEPRLAEVFMKIMCIDDAPDILEVLGLSLHMRWPDVEVVKATDGPTALALFEKEAPDLLIVDLGLPGMDGYEVIRRIRSHSDVPIVILSVRDEEQDIVKGLELGADDYMTKPFGHLQLLARIQAVLRRATASPNHGEDVIEIGRLRINPNTREVHINGRLVILTPTEYSILYHLAKNVGRVLTHQVLVNKVWGNEAVDDHHLLTVHINNLRSKLGDTGQESSMILTERGVGYRLAKETPIPQL
jgi:DNA-binding response OmpR family regulator